MAAPSKVRWKRVFTVLTQNVTSLSQDWKFPAQFSMCFQMLSECFSNVLTTSWRTHFSSSSSLSWEGIILPKFKSTQTAYIDYFCTPLYDLFLPLFQYLPIPTTVCYFRTDRKRKGMVLCCILCSCCFGNQGVIERAWSAWTRFSGYWTKKVAVETDSSMSCLNSCL